MKVYDEMAEDYDALYESYFDIEFYKAYAKKAQKILELGCGTGRVIGKLGKDKECWGIDSSTKMLKIAQKRYPWVKFLHGDMRNFSLPLKLDLIIIPYRSFLHLKNKEKKQALLSIKKHLEKNGTLLIHGYKISKKEKQITEKTVIEDDGESKWYFYFEGPNRAHYEIEKGGKRYEMTLYIISEKEMEELVKECGLRIAETHYLEGDEREIVWEIKE